MVLALVNIISRILAAYGYSVDSDTATSMQALLTPVVHVLSMKLGMEPADPVVTVEPIAAVPVNIPTVPAVVVTPAA